MANHALLIAVGAIFLLPIVFVLLSAVMTDQQVLGAHLWPSPFQWSNFTEVFDRIPSAALHAQHVHDRGPVDCGRGRLVHPGGVRVVEDPVAGPGGGVRVVLSTMMLPFQVTVIPLYILFVRFGVDRDDGSP